MTDFNDKYVTANIYCKEKNTIDNFMNEYVSDAYNDYKKWCYDNDIFKVVPKESFMYIVMAAYNLDVDNDRKNRNKLFFK